MERQTNKDTDGPDNNNEESDSNSEQNDSDTNEECMHLPAISPVSNVSTSSGFISCSSSSSKPTTPTPLNLLTDKNSDEDNFELSIDKENDNLIVLSDCEHESGKLAITKERDSCEYFVNSKCNKFVASTSASSTKGTKLRSKHHHHHHHHHRNSFSSEQQQQHSTRYKQNNNRKHISLDDEIVIYESDSSLVESRRRMNNNNNNLHFTLFSSQNRTSAISRHKSEENPTAQPSNQIVSILKRKDSYGATGSASPSLVTFSPNVKDFESTRSSATHRQGILKKRSSLDESSRRYRSHSPSSASSASSESEKGGCLVRDNRRRNSCEEIHQHHHQHQQGILKQKSYESTGYSSSGTYGSSGVNTPNSSIGVQGILKKPSLTPSSYDHSGDHTTKHVSISEAVILAAAELCKDMIIDDVHEPYIKPILKMESDCHEIKPKPILKKHHSSENEEIRSILKSRKSSREEQEES
jgi:hypothetical protein